jgi:caa(3)-type oxidase subunit IV
MQTNEPTQETPFQQEMGAHQLDPREATHRVHPSAKEYVRIGVILSVLTAFEVWLSYSGLPHSWMIPMLFAASIVKFALVVLWFMHLKFDDGRYSRFFMLGIAGAVTLYLIVLLTFRVFAK